MIVPSNRLLGWAALVLLPGLTLVSLGGSFLSLGLLLVATAVGVAVLDAVSSLERLSHLGIEPESPVHAIVGQPMELRIRLLTNRGTSRERPLALSFACDVPAELESVQFPPRMIYRDAGEGTRNVLTGTTRVLERGRHEIERLHLQTDSLLGFWWIRRTIPMNLLVHGYPDLRSDRRLLAARHFAKDTGVVQTLLSGRGRSFDRLREYVPGDEVDDIHWRATAKRGKPITKLYEIERDQRIYVAVDQSRMSARQSPRQTPPEPDPLALLERYINTALLLGSVAQAQGDQFGLLGFGDRVTAFTPAGAGPVHYRACREAVLEFRLRRVNPDYRELFTFFGNQVRRRSLLFVLTSVDDPALCEELVESAKIIADRHLVVAAAVTPGSARSLSQAEPIGSPEVIVERLASHLSWKRLRQTARQLSQAGIRFLPLDHETMVPHVVSSYARIKRGQLL
jgi:uncharacterized protein (DUF58 family)